MVGTRVVDLDFPLTWLGRRPCRQALCREERGISFASRPIRHLLVGPDGRLAWLLATLSREPELGRVLAIRKHFFCDSEHGVMFT